jgi:hypothetical protein
LAIFYSFIYFRIGSILAKLDEIALTQRQIQETQVVQSQAIGQIQETQVEIHETQVVQSQAIGLMTKETARSFLKRMDCWGTDKRTRVEQEDFKESLIYNYQRQSSVPNCLKCMVLNVDLPRKNVKASHIWKFCTEGEGLEDFELQLTDLSNFRNGFLLYETIEEAFDSKRICFLINPLIDEKQILLKVLDPNLLSEKVCSSLALTFNDIDGNVLQHPVGIFPYRRILYFHAKLAYQKAIRKGWIVGSSTIDTYFELSIDASIPDLNMYDKYFDIDD